MTVSIPNDLILAIDAERTAQIDRFLTHTPITPDPASTAAARLTFQRNEW